MRRRGTTFELVRKLYRDVSTNLVGVTSIEYLPGEDIDSVRTISRLPDGREYVATVELTGNNKDDAQSVGADGSTTDATTTFSSDDDESVMTSYDGDDILRIYTTILENRPALERFQNVKDLHNVIYNFCQVGKTMVLFEAMWISFYVFGKTVCLMLMDSTDSMDKIMDDLVNFNSQSLFQQYPLNASAVNHYYRQMLNDINDGQWLTPMMPILIGTMNPAQLKRMNRCLEEHDVDNLHLFVDEADCLVKNAIPELDTSETGKISTEIKFKTQMITSVTATPFGVLNFKDMRFKVKSIAMGPPPCGYVGVNEFQYEMPFSQEESKAVKNGNMTTLFTRIGHSLQNRPAKPYTAMLINVQATQVKQLTMGKRIARKFPCTNVHVMNSGAGSCIRQVHPDGHETKFRFKHVRALFNMFHFHAAKAQPMENGVPPPFHIIIACRRASRSISFRPSRSVGEGGLDFMIYLPSADAHCAQMEQEMRLCGVYPLYDQIKVIYTTKEVELRLKHELKNFEKMVEVTQEACDAREAIEKHQYIYTKKHDRPAVDDTVMGDKASFNATEFTSVEQVKDAYGIVDENYIVPITKPNNILIPNNHFRNTSNPREQNQVRSYLCRVANLHAYDGQASVLQICWSDSRFMSLFNAVERFNGKGNYNARYVGEICGNEIRIVEFFERFTSPHMKLDDLEGGYVYVARTTRGTYRAFSFEHKDIRTGFLSHNQ